MEIPLNAPVECLDGVFGRSTIVLINPVVDEVTHVVVKADAFPNQEYIVPVDVVSETIVNIIRLRCSKAEVEKMAPFIKTTYIEERMLVSSYGIGGGMYGLGSSYYMPFVTPEITVQVPVEHRQIPPGELPVHRGTRVEATDGYVGQVDEFVINPKNGHITHLVMREGHLWGKKDVIIPVSAIGTPGEETVFLKLDKRQIGSLPTFPLRRRWS